MTKIKNVRQTKALELKVKILKGKVMRTKQLKVNAMKTIGFNHTLKH